MKKGLVLIVSLIVCMPLIGAPADVAARGDASTLQPSTKHIVTDTKTGETRVYNNYDEYAKAEGKYDTNPATNAILVSDAETFKENIHTIKPVPMTMKYALKICKPNRTRGKREAVLAKCDKEQNAEIIKFLLEQPGIDANYLDFTIEDVYSTYVAETYADVAKKYNPLAVQPILSKMDPCVAALTQMQGADDTEPNYYVYADYWREHNCQIEKFAQRTISGNQMTKDLFMLIGKDKKAVEKVFGKEPDIYQRPSEHREVLTYKEAKTRETGGKVQGAKGEFKSYYTDEFHYVITLDRGVVTKVQRLVASMTSGHGDTTKWDYDKLREQEKEQQEKNKGKIVIGRSFGKATLD